MLACMLLSLVLLQNTNPMDLSPDMKQFLDAKIEPRGLQIQRLQTLLDVIFDKNGVNFTYAPVSRTAIETFRKKSGNCISFTIMFISMARYLGLDARFCEIEIPPSFAKNGEFVRLNQHLNAAVFIEGHVYSVDLIPQVRPIEAAGRIIPDERGLAYYYSNMAVNELGERNFEIADRYLKKAIAMDPSAPAVWVNFGVSRAQIGELEEAERYYRKALDLDPRNLPAMTNLVSLLEKAGRIKESAKLKKKVREFQEKNPYYHYSLGMQSYERGDFKEALIQYRRAIKLESKDHNFYFAVARLYAQIGEDRKMRTNLQLAEKYASQPEEKLKYSRKIELLREAQSRNGAGSGSL